jgi:hypothetical protein
MRLANFEVARLVGEVCWDEGWYLWRWLLGVLQVRAVGGMNEDGEEKVVGLLSGRVAWCVWETTPSE